MAKGKLILICHYGGEFAKGGDGSQSYNGGEANAVNINTDTVFDDLKLKLAEMCNFEYKSVSAKYFLPGNTRTLINLGNDKDLIRLLNFHENSVTADVYIFGNEGFDHNSVKADVRRASGVKLAETVDQGTAKRVASTGLYDSESTDVSADSYSRTTSSPEPSNSSSDCYVPKSRRPKNSASIDAASTPAASVKKRRRNAASKPVASDLVNATPTDGTDGRKYGTRSKKARKNQGDLVINVDDVPPGELVASWKKAIVGIGQEFKSVVEFREALRRYAVAHQFAYKFKKSDAYRVSCKCAAEGCPWRIHASKPRSGQTFQIKNMVDSHTCGGETRKSTQPTKEWLASIVKERLRDAPHSKPKELANSISEEFGIQVKYHLVRLAMENVKVQLMGSQKEAYNDLSWFCEKVVEVNPGTIVKLITDDDKRFQRLFLCFHALAFGFQKGCRPLLFLDSTSLRSKYHESLLIAGALDGSDDFFPVAIAVVDHDDEESWIWFLEQLKAAIDASRTLTLVIDGQQLQKELVLKVFENAHIGYSMFHLIERFKRNMKGPFYGDGRGALVRCLTSAAHATRVERFKKCMDELKQISAGSHEWLQQIEPEHWATAMFAGEQYNQVMENPLEPFIKMLEEVKVFPITHKVEVIVQMVVDLVNARQMQSSEWSTKLIPSMEQTLHCQMLKAQKLKVLICSESLFEVRDEYTNVVNVTTKSCTCGAWKDTGLPCCHAMAVFNCTCRNVYDYCSPFFTVDSYKATYSKTINAVPEKSNEHSSDDVVDVLPPVSSRPAAQEKVRQTNSQGLVKRIIVCALCQGAGHNKKTCKLARPQLEDVRETLEEEVKQEEGMQADVQLEEVQPEEVQNGEVQPEVQQGEVKEVEMQEQEAAQVRVEHADVLQAEVQGEEMQKEEVLQGVAQAQVQQEAQQGDVPGKP